LRETIKKLDTAAGKGIFHKNTVARKKSRMQKLFNTLKTAQ
jgi:small subunit ribosomal protein S20